MKAKTSRPITIYKFNPDIVQTEQTSIELDDSKDVFLFVVQSYPDHYTGGRYHIFEIALALCELGKQVIWLCNVVPTCLESFKKYECLKNLTVVRQKHGDPSPSIFNKDYIFKNVVGTPLGCINCVAEYKKQHQNKTKYYQVVWVVPPLASQYREGVDVDDTGLGWEKIKESLKYADYYFTQTNLNRKWLSKWLSVDEKKIYIVPPAVNDKIAQRYLRTRKEDQVVFISRFVSYKNPQHFLEVLKRIEYKGQIIMIGGAGGLSYSQFYEYAKEHNLNLRIIEKCTDDEKFRLISKSRLLIYPTLWEDFGAPPIEAGYYGINTVTYSNPTFKEVYHNLLIYAERDNIDSLTELVKKYLTKAPLNLKLRDYILSNFMFKHIVARVGNAVNTKNSIDFDKILEKTRFARPRCLITTFDGLGDLIMSLPSAYHLYKRGFDVYYRVKPIYKELLSHLNYITGVYVNIPLDTLQRYGFDLMFDTSYKLSQYHKEFCRQNRIDASAFLLGLNPKDIKDKIPKLNLTEKEIEKGKKFNNNRKTVIFAPFATNDSRSYPIHHIQPTISLLTKKYNVILVHNKQFRLRNTTYFLNLTSQLSIRELMSVIYNSDLTISVDAGPVHLAGALDKKILGLYGPIPAEWRLGYYKNAKWIQLRNICRNMCLEKRKHFKLCDKLPQCLNRITPRMIYKKTRSMIR